MSKRILIIESREWLLRLVEQAIREEQPDDEIVLATNASTGLHECVICLPDLLVLGTVQCMSTEQVEQGMRLFAPVYAFEMPPVLHISQYLSSEDERPIFVEIDQLQAAVSEVLAGEPVGAGGRS